MTGADFLLILGASMTNLRAQLRYRKTTLLYDPITVGWQRKIPQITMSNKDMTRTRRYICLCEGIMDRWRGWLQQDTT